MRCLLFPASLSVTNNLLPSRQTSSLSASLCTWDVSMKFSYAGHTRCKSKYQQKCFASHGGSESWLHTLMSWLLWIQHVLRVPCWGCKYRLLLCQYVEFTEQLICQWLISNTKYMQYWCCSTVLFTRKTVISGFRCSENEIFTLLGYYAK